jgi:hypothetical protein
MTIAQVVIVAHHHCGSFGAPEFISFRISAEYALTGIKFNGMSQPFLTRVLFASFPLELSPFVL